MEYGVGIEKLSEQSLCLKLNVALLFKCLYVANRKILCALCESERERGGTSVKDFPTR